ncbi:hypothetical protein Golob_013129 [Gossypium lobatum]|uniref:Aminotransferase-like plant mobile domain-containing protein n=1 Tax=Gossypium lobatum TaxID=34289 RepID=A0A7J8LNG5_9ROSI|nr:hypothetical protein [Gossypium lobatum]
MSAVPIVIFTSSTELLDTFPLITRWIHGPSYARLPTELRDIQFLLDHRSEEEFEWTPYKDLIIKECIIEEFFMNPNIWHVKMSLVVYAIVEIYEFDRVLQ